MFQSNSVIYRIGAMLATSAVLFGLSVQAQAEPFTDWGQEYTGNEANTLALYNFNEDVPLENAAAPGTYTLSLTEPNVATGATGKFGDGLNIDRTTSNDGYASASGSTDLFPGDADPSLTVEAWVRFDTLDDSSMHIIDKRFNDKGGFQLRKWGADGLQFAVGNGSNVIVVQASASDLITVGQWHHIAGTWNADDDTARLYVDGELAHQVESAGSTIVNSSQLMRIGNRLGSSYGSFDGQIDGVRISDVAYEFAPIPEPGSALLLGAGASLCFARRR